MTDIDAIRARNLRDLAMYEGYTIGPPRQITEVATLLQALDASQAEVAELQAIFDMQREAQMRAIKRWQAATGKGLTWPDMADLCFWLAGQLDEKSAALAERDEEVRRLRVFKDAVLALLSSLVEDEETVERVA